MAGDIKGSEVGLQLSTRKQTHKKSGNPVFNWVTIRIRNLTVLRFRSEKVSDTVVNRIWRLNFKTGIDNIVRATDLIFFALHYFISRDTVKYSVGLVLWV